MCLFKDRNCLHVATAEWLYPESGVDNVCVCHGHHHRTSFFAAFDLHIYIYIYNIVGKCIAPLVPPSEMYHNKVVIRCKAQCHMLSEYLFTTN